MIKKWKETIKFICKSDPAIKSPFEVFLYQGFHALFHHQIAHFLYKHKLFLVARFVSQFSRLLTGIEIHPGAKIHHEVFIDHGMGVVIGETAIVGRGVIIYHGVTLGASSLKSIDRHPIIGNDVIIGAHTQIIGRVSIGNNSRLAPSKLIRSDIPPNTILR